MTNTTGIDSQFNLFEAFENQVITNTPSVTFGDIDAYNYLVQQLRTNHLVFCGVEIRTTNQEQLGVPVEVSTEDANGDEVSYQHFPINDVDVWQKASNNVFIATNNLILDGMTTFPAYVLKANTTVVFVIYYRQFFLSSFFDMDFFKLKKPIINNSKGFANEMEYYNDVSEVANNEKYYNKELNKQKSSNKKEKITIFDTEQSVSSLNSEYYPNSFDYLVPFYNKVKVKYQDTNGVCKTTTPTKQEMYVDSEDLDFGNKEFYKKEKISKNPLEGYSSDITKVDDLSRTNNQTRGFKDRKNEELKGTKYRGFVKRKTRYRRNKLKAEKINVKRNYRW